MDNLNFDIQIFLAKPDRTIIGKLNEAYDIQQPLKVTETNEISFSIPYTIERHSEFKKNKHVDEIRQRYLLKVIYLDNQEEWYIITNENDSLEDTNVKKVTAYSQEYQLRDKYIRKWAGVKIDGEYRKNSLNLNQVMNNILTSTNWQVGNVDSILNTRYRDFDFSDTTVLNIIFDIGKKFNAVIEWDTINKQIHFYDSESYGSFNGLVVSDNKYLKSFEKDTKSDEMATRLQPIGKDNLGINEVNPTGVEYIDDFSYFMQGFEMDNNGNVLLSSSYMSDDLCVALTNYNQYVIDKNKLNPFTNLLDQKEFARSKIKTANNELFSLKNELTAIQDKIDLKQSQDKDASKELTNEDAKKTEISNKESEISSLNSDLDNVIKKINDYMNDISIDNHLTKNNLIELNDYIIKKTWENKNISDPQELYDLAVKELEKINKPNYVWNIGVVYLLRIAEAKKDVKKLKLGDKIRVNKKDINELIEAQILEMNIDYDDNDISLTIADTTNLNSDEDELIEKIYSGASASNTIDMNKSIWDDIPDVESKVDGILDNKWDAAKNEIISSNDEEVKINNRGITITDPTDPSRYLRMTNSIIGMFKQDDKMRLAVTPDGITAEELTGRIIIGQHLYMDNSKGTFRFDQDGVTINGTSLQITGGLPENQLDPSYVQKVSDNIQEANTSIGDLRSDVEDMLSDGMMTSIEKNSIKNSLLKAESESTDIIDNGNNLNISTTKYSDAINDLGNYLRNNFLQENNYPISITQSERQTINNKFETVEKEKTTLVNNIMAKHEQIATDYADDLKEQIDSDVLSVDQKVTNLNTYIDGAFEDGVIEQAEAKAIEKHINSLKSEKKDLDERYANIYSNPDLSGSAKTNLNNAKSDYDVSHSNLIDSINTSISDGKVTKSEKTNVDSKFTDYQNKMSSLSDKFEEAIDSISSKKANEAESNANNYTDGQISEVNNSLGTLESSFNEAFSDSKMTSIEANDLDRSLEQFKSESTDIINIASGLSIVTEKNNYKDKINDLDSYLNNHFINQSSYPINITDKQRNKITDKFKSIEDAKSILTNKISSVQSSNAQFNAEQYADGLKKEIDNSISDVNTKVDTLETETKNSFRDGVISEAESISLESYINQLNNEKEDIDNRYNVIVLNENIDANFKNNLDEAKTAYDTSHSTLITSINDAIKDNSVTSKEKNTVNDNFSDYKVKLGNLSDNLEKCVDNIAQNKADNAESNAKNYTDKQLTNYVDASLYKQDISEIKDQINGNITSYFKEYEPSLDNKPASTWKTDEDKNNHLGDMFYNETNGYSYRFALKNNKYQWVRIQDSDVQKALSKASNAQDTADDKRRVFVKTPTPPYNIGDLWSQGDNGDLLRSVANKSKNESYNSSDWVKTSKYTDDTRAEEAESNAKNYTDNQVSDVNNSLGTLESSFNEAFSDGTITTIEANTLENNLQQLKDESTDLINIADSLGVSRSNYNSALNSLETELNNWINQTDYPKDISQYQRNKINNLFGDVQKQKSKLVNNISDKQAENAKDDSVGKGELINGVKIDTSNGLMVTRSDNKVKSTFNATDGIKIETKKGTSWNKEFYYDVNNERLVVDGEINARELKVNGNSVLTTDNDKIDGQSIDEITTDQIKAGQANISTAMIENLEVGTNVSMGTNASISWRQVNNQPFIPNDASDVGALPSNSSRLTYMNSNGIYTGTLNANKIITGYLSGNRIKGGKISGTTINSEDSNGNEAIIKNGRIDQISYHGHELNLLPNYFNQPSLFFSAGISRGILTLDPDKNRFYLNSNESTEIDAKDSVYINTDFSVTGTKNARVSTSQGYVNVSAYETAEYYFGDIGREKVKNGECLIKIEELFKETVNTSVNYEVFLTPYGNGNIYVDVNSMTPDSFVVKGDNIPFAYEIKAKRKGFEDTRLEAGDIINENKSS